jgi:L-ascorbate metabolism protein UlaG (beta-lactamase superfamily)
MSAAPSFPGVPIQAVRMMHLREQPRDGSFRLWWLGQSGFALRYHHEMAVLDPYLSDSLTTKYAKTDKPHVRMKPIYIEPRWLAQSLITVITASHHHTDHLDPDTLRPIMKQFHDWNLTLPLIAPEAWRTLAAERAGVEPAMILGLDDGASAKVRSFEFIAVPAAHETIERDEEGRCKYLGYIIRFGGWSIYHSGDTVLYDGMVERLRAFAVDVALLPINGRSSARRVAGNLSGHEAAWLAKEIGAKLVIPCHYDMFDFNTADPANEFIPECERIAQPYRVLQLGERFASMEIRK